MNSKQNQIFGKPSEGPQEEQPQSRKQTTIRKIFSFIAKAYGLLKGIAGFVGVIWFLWGTVGEYSLPHEWRFSTFMGGRLGSIKSEENRKSAVSDANKQEVMTAAQGAPQITQQCEMTRLVGAQQTFAACMEKPGSLLTGCEFQRDAVLAQKCEKIVPGQLSETYTATQKKGQLP